MATQFIGTFRRGYPAYGSGGPITPTPLPTPLLVLGTPTATTIPVSVAVNAHAIGYRLQLATNASFTTGLITSPDQTASSGATAVPYTFTGLAAGITYYVRAMLVGNGVMYSDSVYAAGVQVTTAATTPTLSAPGNLRQTGSTSASTTLAWNAITGADSYELRRGSSTIYSGPNLIATDSGLSAATGYGYTVRALDSTGGHLPSVYSGTVTATTAAATPTPGNFYPTMVTDSRGGYRGEGQDSNTDHNLDQTTSVWAFTQNRLTTGSTYTGTIAHFCQPGAKPADFLNPNYSNNYEYATAKASGVSVIDDLLTKIPAGKTAVVLVSAGANPGPDAATTLADIKAIHDHLKAQRPGTITIADWILDRNDATYPTGIPDLDTVNAGILAGVGVWCDDIARSYNTPQLSAPDAPKNPNIFWQGDFVNLSGVHLVTAGNRLNGQVNYADAFARQLGLTLDPLLTTQVSTGLTQTNPIFHFTGGKWTNFSYNVQYITNYGGVTQSDTGGFGFTAQCYGFRIVNPTSTLFGAIKAEEAGQTIATGTQYSNDPPSNAAPASVCLSKYYGSTLATHEVEISHNGSPSGTYLCCNLVQFCDANGVFPPIPAPVNYVHWTTGGGATTDDNAHTLTDNATNGNWGAVGFGTRKGSDPLTALSLIAAIGGVGGFIFGFTDGLKSLVNYTDIDWGFYLDRDGTLNVYHNNALVVSLGQVNNGALLEIKRTAADTIDFFVNGVRKPQARYTGTLPAELNIKACLSGASTLTGLTIAGDTVPA